MRVAAAFDWNGVLAPANVRVDAWVTPPAYTGKPPIILSAANKDAGAPDSGPLAVPSGSTLLVRSSGGTIDVVVGGGVTEIAPGEAAPQGTNERHFKIAGDGTAHVRAPAGQPQWKFTATPDNPPKISLAKDPERQARGSLQMSYKLEDDYGVTEARAQFAARAAEATESGRPVHEGSQGRPRRGRCSSAPSFPLVLPNARTRNGVGQTVKDLSEDPYAGAEVTLTLTAKDEAGNEGKSEPFNMRLPERLFTKPLARALIEQRRHSRARRQPEFAGLCRARRADDRAGTVHAGNRPLLGLYSIARQLEAARTDVALREVVASLWALAVTIEDGNISDVEKALRAAQEALKQALERGASDEEIKKLTDNLRAALDNFLRQLAEQMQKNPQQLARPLDPNTKMLSQNDLKNMLDRLERMSRSGDKEAAKQLLEQLQQMLENLQMAQPGQSGDNDMEQALNELGDMIRKQQQLRDKTYKQGQDSRRDRMRGKQGDQSMGDLQQDQQGLRDRLKKLQEELAKRGMGPGQRGEHSAARACRISPTARAGRRRGRPGAGRWRHGRCRRPARRGQCRRRGGFARQGAGSAAQGRAEARRSDAAGRRRPARRRPRQHQGPPAGRAERHRSTRPPDAPQRIHRRLLGEDPRRNRRAAGAPDSGRTAPPAGRSVTAADRTRLHRAAAEGLLRRRPCNGPNMRSRGSAPGRVSPGF